VDADITLPWLSRLLESLKPSIDTSLPESTRAATARLEKELDEGKAEQALPEIEQRLKASTEQNRGGGEDVQMLFLKARALNMQGKRAEAKDIYRDMTQRFPELPEPWNNLAALEVLDGRLEQAKMALDTAIRNDPSYAVARENQGDLFMMLAARSYNDALKLAPQNAAARDKESGIKSLLEAKTPLSTSPRTR
jgi:tetratricopeptide (TPR) repeat protein